MKHLKLFENWGPAAAEAKTQIEQGIRASEIALRSAADYDGAVQVLTQPAVDHADRLFELLHGHLRTHVSDELLHRLNAIRRAEPREVDASRLLSAYLQLLKELSEKLSTNEARLFENYAQEHDIATLRDVVDPDHFDTEDAAQDWEDTKEAALWTCQQLGIEPGPGAKRLLELGITDLAGLLQQLPLERVVEVFNTLATSWHDVPRFRELVRTLPGLLSLDEQGDLIPSPKAEVISQSSFGEISTEAFTDRRTGTVAVYWRAEHNDGLFMLDSSLA